MKRLSWSLAALAALAAASCARRELPAPAPTVLSRHLSGDPATLDPTTTTEDSGLLVEEMLFRPLVGFDAQLRVTSGLARSWTVSEDGLSYEFRLDPAARWEDGSPVTSDDVRFTVERIRDPKVPAQTWKSGFENLTAIETPDPATVRFRFQEPYSERLSAFALPIVSAAAYARAKAPAETDRKPVGSGPYRLESWEPNQKIRLLRRPEAASPAGFSEVQFRVIPDSTVRFQAGSRGELDEFRVTRDQLKTAEASADFQTRNRILKVPSFLEVMLLWNCRNPFLADPRVRRALAMAWARTDVARRLYPPDGAVLASGPYPPGAAENAADVSPPPFDPAASARLLEDAGWKIGKDGFRRKAGKKASVEILYRAGPVMDANLVEILRAAYAGIGVEPVPRALDWAAFAQRADAGDFEALLYARYYVSPNLDPYPFYDGSQWPPGGQNIGFYRNAEADRVMQAARRELDAGKRLELYRQVHRVMASDPPADFMWGVDQYWAVARRVDGVQISPLGLFHFLPGPLGWHPAPAAAR